MSQCTASNAVVSWFVKEILQIKLLIIFNPSERRPRREQSFRTDKWDVLAIHVSFQCFIGSTLRNTSDLSF
jgi:hypothetical protein